jgi:hypothetical protein
MLLLNFKEQLNHLWRWRLESNEQKRRMQAMVSLCATTAALWYHYAAVHSFHTFLIEAESAYFG